MEEAEKKFEEAGADIIMLDNMSHEQLQEAIIYIDGRAEVEVSGNVTKENIARLTEINYIPVRYIISVLLTIFEIASIMANLQLSLANLTNQLFFTVFIIKNKRGYNYEKKYIFRCK